jgi:translation initiation factor 3 subunit G
MPGTVSAAAIGLYIPPRRFATTDTPVNHEKTVTVRVDNFSRDADERDVEDLFGPFGRLQRVSVAKHSKTKQRKGVAFVNFYNKSDAEAAIVKLDGYRYDSLVLQVRWA